MTSFGVARVAATALVAARLARTIRAAPPISVDAVHGSPTISVVIPARDEADRLARTIRAAPPISVDAVHGSPTISVVIPARDEADRLGDAVASVVGGRSVIEVIVVDDESSDATADVAQASGARVVEAPPRPPGWAGKPWAIQCGVAAATGEWVVTLDADTRADPNLPAVVVARAQCDALDLLTVAARFRNGTPPARWLQAAMIATLVYRFGAPGTPARATRVLANGQCMTFRRADFLERGGFRPVASSPVEDVALARHAAHAGLRVAFLDASALLAVEAYPTLRTTWQGWGRSLGLPGVQAGLSRAVDVLVLALTMPVPLARMAMRQADVVDLVALALRVGTLAGMRRAVERRDAAYWLSPLADAPALVAMTIGGFRSTQTWRGRSYVLRRGPGRTARR